MIVIGRLHIGAVLPEWLSAWEELRKPATSEGRPDWVTFSAIRQVVHCARNEICRYTLEQHPDATHLFFLDDDVCMPPDGLLRLLDDSVREDLPIVSGLYIQRAGAMLPVAHRRMADGHFVNLTAFCDGLQEIDACGAGCLLIRTDVLRAIQATGEPWFDWDLGVSEDLAFCLRAKRLGFRIALDADVKCGHLGIVNITYDYFAERQRQGIAYATPEIEAASVDVRPWTATTAAAAEAPVLEAPLATEATRSALPRRRRRRVRTAAALAEVSP